MVPRHAAAAIPSGSATTSATSIAANANSNVAGRRSAICSTHRRASAQRRPEIAGDRAGEKAPVLLEEGPVEAKLPAQRIHVCLRRRLAEHGLGGIAGNQMNQREHQRRDSEEHGNRQRDATGDEPQHRAILF